MKFFVKGFYHNTCNQADKLSTDGKKEFEEFLDKCHSLDFQQKAEESTAP